MTSQYFNKVCLPCLFVFYYPAVCKVIYLIWENTLLRFEWSHMEKKRLFCNHSDEIYCTAVTNTLNRYISLLNLSKSESHSPIIVITTVVLIMSWYGTFPDVRILPCGCLTVLVGFFFLTFEINLILATSVLQLVLMEPRFHWFSLVHKTQNCSTNVQWGSYKQQFHVKKMRKYRGASCQCLLHIKTILRQILRNKSENSGEKKILTDCCNVFIALCILSIKSNAYHLRSCCSLSQEVTSSAILAKFSKVTNCRLLWFHFSASHPIECCLLFGTTPEGGERFLLAGGWSVSFPSGDNQLC